MAAPIATRGDRRVPPRHRGTLYRRRVAGAMLVAFGGLTLVGLGVLPGLAANAPMLACSVAAFLLGGVLMAVPGAAPEWSSQLLVGFVTVLITVGMAAGHGAGSVVGDLSVLYVPTAVYAFYFFSTRTGMAQVAWVGLCYGLYLSLGSDGTVAGEVARWGTTVAATLVSGFMIRGMNAEVERLVGELASAATRDALTDVWNRRGFDERLDVELARARRTGEPLTLVAADVDGLKGLNDSAGHAAGDEAIELTARVLGQDLRDVDSLGRIGGDEFVILLPACDLASGEQIAGELRARLGREAQANGLDLTLSLGVATAPPCTLDARALRAQADAALYAAKGLGRDRVVAVGADEGPAPSSRVRAI